MQGSGGGFFAGVAALFSAGLAITGLDVCLFVVYIVLFLGLVLGFGIWFWFWFWFLDLFFGFIFFGASPAIRSNLLRRTPAQKDFRCYRGYVLTYIFFSQKLE